LIKGNKNNAVSVTILLSRIFNWNKLNNNNSDNRQVFKTTGRMLAFHRQAGKIPLFHSF